MDNTSMFDTLMQLPLFQGVSLDRMSEVVGKAKFHFLKYLPDNEVVHKGDPCTHIKFILAGSVRSTVTSADGKFCVSQTLKAPAVIAPDFLFGKATDYPSTVTALTPTNVLQISKADYLNILTMDQVFMLNYLNYLSMNAQKAVGGVLALAKGSIEERIAFWIIALTQPMGEDIVLQCRHRDLYSVFGVQRSTFMAALEAMKTRGYIDYTPDTIRILNRRDMLDLLTSQTEE